MEVSLAPGILPMNLNGVTMDRQQVMGFPDIGHLSYLPLTSTHFDAPAGPSACTGIMRRVWLKNALDLRRLRALSFWDFL